MVPTKRLVLAGFLQGWYLFLQSISEPLQDWNLEALLECRVEVWEPQLQGELHYHPHLSPGTP